METIGKRLRNERKRLGHSQMSLAAAAGLSKNAQINYESDRRRPDAEYLVRAAAAGVDVLYVLTGERNASQLSTDEQVVLVGYRSLDSIGRAGVLGMIGGMTQHAAQDGASRKVEKSFEGATTGERIKGDITAPFTINMGTDEPKKKLGG